MAAAQNITHLQNITHVIVGLNTGGAEMSLLRLLQATRQQLKHRVICFGRPTDIGEQMAALDVPVLWLDYAGLKLPGALLRARREVRTHVPDVLQGWMYYGNLLASLLAPRRHIRHTGQTRVGWNIRHNLSQPAEEKLRIRAALQLARLPFLQPDLLVYNSHSGGASHRHLGFKPRVQQIIPNGVDTRRFKPDPGARQKVRAQWPQQSGPWVGMVGRFHPHKGVALYLRVVRGMLDAQPHACRFCLAGPGMTTDNPRLRGMMTAAGLQPDDLALLGPSEDMPALLNALDVLLLTSRQEASPNVLLEAMACGTAVVATGVGDVARILDDPQRVAALDDAADMQAKLSLVLADPRQWQARDRQRVTAEYPLQGCMQAYVDVYRELAA